MTSDQNRALELACGHPLNASNLVRVGREVGDDLARWAFEQHSLRRAAATKFLRASEMLFVREALEQATHPVIANWRANQFPAGVRMADLTAGIGGDALALAGRGPIVAYETDGARAECLEHNLAVHGAGYEIRQADCLVGAWDFDYAFADPARRVEGRRTLDVGQFQPRPDALAERMATLRLAAIKLSPLLPDGWLEAVGPSLEFVSAGRQCREAVVWLGKGAEPGRRAVLAETGERIEACEVPGEVECPGRYIVEADPAAIRAHALGVFGLPALGRSNGYLAADEIPDSRWLRAYQVLEVLPYDRKRVKALLQSMNARLEVLKCRGVKLDAESERKALDPRGGQPRTCIVYPTAEGVRIAVTIDVPNP